MTDYARKIAGYIIMGKPVPVDLQSKLIDDLLEYDEKSKKGRELSKRPSPVEEV